MKSDNKKSRKWILLVTGLVLVLILSIGYFANTTARSHQTWMAINRELIRSHILWVPFIPSALEAYLGHSAYILLLEKPFPAEKSGTVVQECIFATVVYLSPTGTINYKIDYKFVVIHEEKDNKMRLLLLERGSILSSLPRTECVYPSARGDSSPASGLRAGY